MGSSSLKRKRANISRLETGNSTERPVKRTKTQQARHISVQAQDKALENGKLDVEKFVQARAWEIRALQAGMKGAKLVASFP